MCLYIHWWEFAREYNCDITIALVYIMMNISSYMMKIYLFIQNISWISHDNIWSITQEHSSKFSENKSSYERGKVAVQLSGGGGGGGCKSDH